VDQRHFLAAILQRVLAKTVTDTTEHDRKYKPEADMPYLRAVYGFAAGAAGLTYLYLRLTSPVSLTHALFTGIRDPHAAVGMMAGISKFLRYDQIAAFSAGAIWTLLSFGDLKRKGRVTAGWAKIVGAFAGMTLVGGPGAAMAGMWAWREEALAKRIHPTAPKAAKKE